MSRDLAATERLLKQFVGFVDDSIVGSDSVFRSFQQKTERFSAAQEASLMAFLASCIEVFLESENWESDSENDKAQATMERLDAINNSDMSAKEKYSAARSLLREGI